MEIDYIGVLIAIFIIIVLIFIIPFYTNYVSVIISFLGGNQAVAVIIIFTILIFLFLGLYVLVV